jgi:DNA-directed RNA polymerase subunit RPC12/RpoP
MGSSSPQDRARLEELGESYLDQLHAGLKAPDRVRCPHCGQLIELGGAGCEELGCPNCGSTFALESGLRPPDRGRGRRRQRRALGRGKR